MKKTLLVIGLSIFLLNCEDNESLIDSNQNHNQTQQVSYPYVTGLLETSFVQEPAEPLPNMVVGTSFPNQYDLSPLMPPVSSQKNQKSAVAFATSYYLKSFHEKIEHNYQYNSDNELMSPAFVYNQVILNGNCNQPIAVEDALYILKTKGTNTLADFSYQEYLCNTQPNNEQLEFAELNKIASYHNVLNNTLSASTIDILKTLLLQNTPIILGLKIDSKFKSASQLNEDGIYIYKEKENLGNLKHCMLIVGYDDSLNAFKIINSWGTEWANEGYAYVHYNFFLDQTQDNYKEGLISLHIAMDL
jgi:C1A family cysteine protease